nr:hypothetical protein GCM10020092_077530 [Actinoplanes digitatis]
MTVYGTVSYMAEKLAIVTGASGGIGFHTARELAARNWRVITAARHRNDDIPGAEWWELDLADLASVRRFASRFLDGYGSARSVDQQRRGDGPAAGGDR